jgi:hypothetical protein
MVRVVMVFVASVAALSAGAGLAQQPAASEKQHVRGEITKVEGNALEVKTSSGETMKLKLADTARVGLVEKADMASISDGAFIGTTAVPQADGTLRAVEVHVFAEKLRGTGEGHQPWDLEPGSTMTNATVAKTGQGGGGTAASGGTGSTMTNATVANVQGSGGAKKLQLKFKGGEKTVVVPAGIPVVKIEPGDRSKLVRGAHAFIIASRQPDGTLVAERLNVGARGVVPPM